MVIKKKGRYIKCYICETDIYKFPSRLKEGKKYYCSTKCGNISPDKIKASSIWIKKLNKNKNIRNKGAKTQRINNKKFNRKPWNKGLKRKDDERVNRVAKLKEGKPRSKETRQKLREVRAKQIIDAYELTGNVWAQIGINETEIINHLEKIHNIKFKRQYLCGGYFIDGYNEEYKLAIEIDEPFHDKQKKKDLERQNYIENRLGCKFIRIPDSYIKIIRGEK